MTKYLREFSHGRVACLVYFYVLLASFCLPGQASAQRMPTTDLPPGISIPQDVPATHAIPPQFRIDCINIDWTDPRLKTSFLMGEASDEGSLSWGDIGERDPRALRVQLSVPDPDLGRLKLPVFHSKLGRETEVSETFVVEHVENIGGNAPANRNYVHVGGISPWTFSGPGTAGLPGWNGDLGVGGTSVELNWLGTRDEWILNPPGYKFGEKVLLSTLNPLIGHGSFYLIQNGTGRPIELSALTPWIREAVSGQHLIAVHSDGRHVEIGQGLWRMGGPGEFGGSTPAGAVLLLGRKGPGDLEDVARRHAIQVTSSSYEFAYPPSQVTSGRLWPVALRPPVWLSRDSSRSGENDSKPGWIDLGLEQTASVEEIRLVHLGAAGWSEGFNPGEVEITLRTQKDFESPQTIRFSPKSNISVVRLAIPQDLMGIRVTFSEPSRFNAPGRAGLMALQVRGRIGDLGKGERGG